MYPGTSPYPPQHAAPQPPITKQETKLGIGIGILVSLLVIAVLVGIFVIHSLTPSSSSQGYLYSDATGVIYLNVTVASSGDVGGSISFDYLSNSAEQHATYSVTGVESDGGMALTIHGALAIDVAFQAQAFPGGMTATIPDSKGAMHSYRMLYATNSDYQQAVSNWEAGLGPIGG